MSGDEWVFRYGVAKRTFEKYGDSPPIGAETSILINGCNTSMPTLLCEKDLQWLPKATIVSVDGEYVVLSRDGKRYLIDKIDWHFCLMPSDN